MLFDEAQMQVVWYDERADKEYVFPARYEVCGDCRGRGRYVDQDDGDVPCGECCGLRVVPMIDDEKAKRQGLDGALDEYRKAERETEA